jgi:hypothetical protein
MEYGWQVIEVAMHPDARNVVEGSVAEWKKRGIGRRHSFPGLRVSELVTRDINTDDSSARALEDCPVEAGAATEVEAHALAMTE